MRILIVEDEPFERRALKVIIEEEFADKKMVISEASTGLEAVKSAIENEPDVVLLDIEMPELNGLECLSSLRNAGIVAPVLVLTAYSEFEYAQQALKLGVKDYLLKPISRRKLIAALSAVVPKRSRNQTTALRTRAERTVVVVTALIESHMTQSLTLEQIGERIGLSPAYISRCFRDVTGHPFKEYVSAMQMQIVLDLLREPGASIARVARAVGFSDPNYFCKVFKRTYGVTPSEFRNGQAASTSS